MKLFCVNFAPVSALVLIYFILWNFIRVFRIRLTNYKIDQGRLRCFFFNLVTITEAYLKVLNKNFVSLLEV